jgi:hypothetical protein
VGQRLLLAQKLWLLMLRLAALVLALLILMRLKLQLNKALRKELMLFLKPCLLLNKLIKRLRLLALHPELPPEFSLYLRILTRFQNPFFKTLEDKELLNLKLFLYLRA